MQSYNLTDQNHARILSQFLRFPKTFKIHPKKRKNRMLRNWSQQLSWRRLHSWRNRLVFIPRRREWPDDWILERISGRIFKSFFNLRRRISKQRSIFAENRRTFIECQCLLAWNICWLPAFSEMSFKRSFLSLEWSNLLRHWTAKKLIEKKVLQRDVVNKITLWHYNLKVLFLIGMVSCWVSPFEDNDH